MVHNEIAKQAGVNLGDLASLRNGTATASVANRLGLTMAEIEDFLRGRASQSMAQRLGLTTISAADELARTMGKDGAAGIILGLLLSR